MNCDDKLPRVKGLPQLKKKLGAMLPAIKRGKCPLCGYSLDRHSRENLPYVTRAEYNFCAATYTGGYSFSFYVWSDDPSFDEDEGEYVTGTGYGARVTIDITET